MMNDKPADYKSIKREFSSDAPGDPERFRRVELTNQEMMAQGDAMRATFDSIREPVGRLPPTSPPGHSTAW